MLGKHRKGLFYCPKMAKKTTTDDTRLTESEKALKRSDENLKRAVSAVEHNYSEAIEDGNFLLGGEKQWNGKELERRKRRGRPCLTINQLPKYIKQAEGELRQNKPRIKVRPLTSEATPAIAQIREGLLRRIFYESRSDAIFDQCGKMQMSTGYGALRVLTRFKDNETFNQEIYIQLIKNPFSVYMDPDCMDMVRADAKYAFIFDSMSEQDFKKEYPQAAVPGVDDFKKGKGTQDNKFYVKDKVVVAEYYEKHITERTICLLSDDRIMEKKEAEEEIDRFNKERDAYILQLESMDPIQSKRMQSVRPIPEELSIKRKRKAHDSKIFHYKRSAIEILEGPTEVAGKYVPVVMFYGEEINIEGKDHVQSLIRNAKDPQQLFNYWNSAGAEVIALAPKAPYIGTAEQFKGFEEDWASANLENFPYLKYNPDPLAQGPPQRNTASQIVPAGIFAEIGRSEQAIKDSIGMYGAGFENPGNERGVKAVLARRMPTDMVTYIYVDNHSRAVEHTARIINDMLPIIYDTEQDALVRTSDNVDRFVPINTTTQRAFDKISQNPSLYSGMDAEKLKKMMRMNGRNAKYNDLEQGEYAVIVEVGPSYQTQRMEAAENLLRLVQYMPEFRKLSGDLIAENLDFKDAEELARRYRKTALPPGLVPPEPGEDNAPLPPPPQAVAMMKKLEIDNEKLKVQQAKLMVELAKVTKETGQSKKEIVNEVLQALAKMGPQGALTVGAIGQSINNGRRR